MEIKEMNVEDLFPYWNNPRKTEKAVDAVAESIRQYGFKVPMIVDKNNIIIAGHTRLEAAKKIGLEKVPVIVAEDLTEEQAKALRLADNKVAEFSTWDFEKLEQELDDLDGDSWVVKLFRKDLEERVREAENVEIDLSEFDDEAFKYECAHCGFRFN